MPLCLITVWMAILLFHFIACDGKPNKPAPQIIRLSRNPWIGSAINVAIAKLLIEKNIGYQVEIVPLDEYIQWESLANGKISACLEIWPSGHSREIQKYIGDENRIENIGVLGVVGRIGWYLPAYVIEDHPELATWDGLKNPKNAALFRTATSGEKGRFLGAAHSWVQYDDDIIRNLGLKLVVEHADSEQGILTAVDAAYRKKEPILFYFWTPHFIHSKYRLIRVQLPQYTDACHKRADAGGVNCDYPPDILFKVAWSGLRNHATDAYRFLKNFNISSAEQMAMIAEVALEGKRVDAVAQKWIDANKDKWIVWLPDSYGITHSH